MQGQDWVDSADDFRRADVRIYKFEQEKIVTCSKKETLDIRLAEVKRSRNGLPGIARVLGAEAAILRMYCFSIFLFLGLGSSFAARLVEWLCWAAVS